MPVREDERPRYDIETIKVDGIEPAPEMKELPEKEKRGEITRKEIRKMFDRGYKMKVQWSLQRNSLTLELQRFDDIPAISIIGRGG